MHAWELHAFLYLLNEVQTCKIQMKRGARLWVSQVGNWHWHPFSLSTSVPVSARLAHQQKNMASILKLVRILDIGSVSSVLANGIEWRARILAYTHLLSGLVELKVSRTNLKCGHLTQVLHCSTRFSWLKMSTSQGLHAQSFPPSMSGIFTWFHERNTKAHLASFILAIICFWGFQCSGTPRSLHKP